MKKLFKPLLLPVVTVFVLSSFVEDKGAKLTVNLNKGDVINTEYVMEIVTFSMDLGASAASETKMTMKFNQSVESKEADGYELKGVFTAIKMNVSAAGNEMTYDSEAYNTEDPFQAQMHASMSGMLNKSFIGSINNRGETVGEVDYSAFSAEIVETMQLENMTENFSFVLPEGKINEGDSWTAPREATSNGITTKVNSVYIVKEIKKDVVILDVTGDISGEGTTQGIPATIKGTQSGTVTIDRNIGLPVLTLINQNAELIMSMGAEEAKMSLTTKINAKSTVE